MDKKLRIMKRDLLPPNATPTWKRYPKNKFGIPKHPPRTTKQINCPHYEKCLYFAAKLGWEDFHCENCPLLEERSTSEQ